MFKENPAVRVGFVSFVGAGPGAVDLITVRGLRALQEAEVVLFDELPGRELLAHCRPEAERVSVGKRAGCRATSQSEINALLRHHAGRGKRVVRLKGGDPTVFGRLGEEMEALRAAQIPFEVIPGVTAACAAAAAAGISLTRRNVASTVILTTGHECAGKAAPTVDWAALAQPGATLGIYMGARALGSIARRLIAAGLPVQTPLLIISHASRPTQSIRSGTLADVDALAAVTESTPSLILIGESAISLSSRRNAIVPLAHATA